jgi:starch-binding outer membrane protein, SusD/RagB family
MKKIYNIVLAFSLLIMASCSDFLEIKNESSVDDQIFNSYATATMYLNTVYSLCMPSFGGEYVFSSTRATACSDEVIGNTDLAVGELTLGSAGTYSANTYQAIRYINIAFKKLEGATFLQTDKNKILGQLYFFRAFQHWKMVQIYGGVPYMNDVIDFLSSEELTNSPRNKTSECIAFMKADLDKAIELLPASWDASEYGRVTRAAAAGILGRILLHYASPQFTPDQAGSLAKERWEAAYQANKRASEIAQQDGYGLFDCSASVSNTWPAPSDINKIFITEQNKEVLLVRCYEETSKNSHGYESSVRPEDQTNSGSVPSNCPSLMLVAAFPNADGTMYRGTYTDAYYWKNRDPRFYSTIVYNGCYFPNAAEPNRRQWTYTGGDPANRTTETGFYCRKMLNPNTKLYAQTGTDWVELRYAEVLLNLAEAALMTNRENETYDCLGQLRKRAGIVEGSSYYGLKATADNDYTLLEKVMNERRIELAFEGKRFWDLRRWNMFTSALGAKTPMLNGQRKGSWLITFTLKNITAQAFSAIRDNADMDKVSEYTSLAKKPALPTFKSMKYLCVPTYEELSATTNGNYNFFDIPSNILDRSPAVKQTLGWTGGSFNPFE